MVLFSVVAHVHYDVELGDIIDMELLRRHKNMRSVMPLHAHEATEVWNELYAKLIVISLRDVSWSNIMYHKLNLPFKITY